MRILTCGSTVTALLAALAFRRLASVPLQMETIDPLVNPLGVLPMPARLFAALELSGRYLAYLLIPVRFSDPHGYGPTAQTPAASDAGVVLSALMLAGWCLATLVLWLRRDRVAPPLAFSLASFLPAANLIVPIGSLYAQNFLYLPLIGVCLAFADLLGRVRWLPRPAETIPETPRRAPLAIATVLLSALAVGSYRESGIWRDALTLFGAFTHRFPNYAWGHHNLGITLMEAGRPTEAVAPLRKALALDDRNVETYDKLSVALMTGALDRADIEESLRLNRTAVGLMVRRLAEARTRAAMDFLLLDRSAEAEAEAREALRLLPEYVPARSALAEVLFKMERYAEAVPAYKELTELRPGEPGVLSPYIVSLLRAGDLQEARRHAEAARKAFPGVAWFDFCLARIEARSGRKREALELLSASASRDPATREWLQKVDDFESFRGDPAFDRLTR
jgi:tetratricopeptide (TPR) repeat protein